MSEESPTPNSEAAPSPPPLPQELQAAVGDLLTEGFLRERCPELHTTPGQLLDLLTRLSRQMPEPFDMLTAICGVDRGEVLEVVYRLYRAYSDQGLVVKVRVPRGGEVPSATDLWKLAGWAEREVAEMFGVSFTGHPDLRKLLLPDEFEGHPLLKDFVLDRSDPYLSPDPLRDDPIGVLFPEARTSDQTADDEEE